MGDSPRSGNDNDSHAGTPCARIEREIAAANERLRVTAQNFSLEWKAFLSYAMTTKASTSPASDSGDGGLATEQRGLEDLLLHSQSGLVMLREMQTRRGCKWREIRAHYGYEHPSVASDGLQADLTPSGLQRRAPATPGKNQLAHALAVANREIADAARVVLSTQRLDLPFVVDSPLSTASILGAVGSDSRDTQLHVNTSAQCVVVRVRTQAIATANEFEAMERGVRESKRLNHVQSVSVADGDVEELLEVTFERRQLQIALERLFTRMKWLCTSHRYHLRHRTLYIVHQQRQQTGELPQRKTGEAATTAARTSDGQCCPLLVSQTKQSVEAELEVVMRAEHSLSVPRGKHNELDTIYLKEVIDELFHRGLEATAVDRQSTDERVSSDSDSGRTGDLGFGGTRLVVERATRSRWDLLQAPYCLGSSVNSVKQEAARDHRRGLTAVVSTEDDDDVDAMLKNEWRLLQLSDASFMRSRLEALATNHEHRAAIAISTPEPAGSRAVPLTRPSTSDGRRPSTAASVSQSTTDKAPHSPDRPDRPKTATPTAADPLKALPAAATTAMSEASTALYSLYALRVLSSRCQRRRLLRLLNYAHYLLHVSHQASTTGSTLGGDASSTTGDWRISRTSSGESIVLQVLTTRDDNSKDDKSATSEAKEFVFEGARHDLRALERQMMRVGSHFIRQQEQNHFRQCEDHTGAEYAFPTIDRLQVLHDLFECQIAFQAAKLQLVELLLGNGLLGHRASDDEYSGLRIITAVLQTRPMIDFTHRYFVESFASETIQLELQIRLQQQLQDHSLAASKVLYDQENVSSLRSTDERERCVRLALARRSQSAKSIARFWSLQEKLVDQAEAKWFNATSVTERHALRQAVYEQLLVTWQLVTKIEIPAAPIHTLERSAVDILYGNGLQVVLRPSLLIDTCRQLHARAQSSAQRRSLSEWLATAWMLMEWHQRLAHSVYEASVLDRIYRFQYSFVREMEHANEQARLFFFDAAGGSGSDPTTRDGFVAQDSMLTPIAIQLGLVDAGAPGVHSEHLDGSRKTVPNWVEHQLWTSMAGQERLGDVTANVLDGVCHGDAALLRLQRQWVEFLSVRVDFHDRVGAHVFEFASSSSFIALEAMRQRQQPTKQGGSVFTAIDVDLVRIKYANDVAHKMTEEMQQRCYPYWTCLDMLKQQLRSQFRATDTSDHSDNSTSASVTHADDEELERIDQRAHVGVVVRVESVDACCRYLSRSAAAPRLLAQLDDLLQRLRNEAQLSLSCGANSVCAFLIPGDDEDDDHSPNVLAKWFVSKFDQLKKDLQVHDKSARTTDNAPCQSRTHQFAVNTTDDNAIDNDSDGRHTCESLLRSVPSFSVLLRQFVTSRHASASNPSDAKPTNRSDHTPPRQNGTASPDHQEATAAALRGLVMIYSALVQVLELCRVCCALLGDGHQANRILAGTSTDDLERLGTVRGDAAGRKLLVQGQSRVHGHVRERLRELAGCIDTQTGTDQDGKATTKESLAPLALFTSPLLERDVHRAHTALTLRLKIERASQRFLEQERQLTRFVLAAAAIQTFGGGFEGRQRRLDLLELDAIVRAGADCCDDQDASRRLRKSLHRFPVSESHRRPLQHQAQQAELQSLWDTVNSTDLHPLPSPTKTVATTLPRVAVLAQLLRLQRVFLEEHIDHQAHVHVRLVASATPQSAESYANDEAAGLRSLVGAWESFHAINFALSDDENLDDDVFARLCRQPPTIRGGDSRSRAHNTPGVVSGDSLRLKTRLLGDGGVASTDKSGAESINVTRWIALECLTLGQQTRTLVSDSAAAITVHKALCLPSEERSREFVRWLHGALELAWIHRDMGDIQAHYNSLLQYRKQHRSRASPADDTQSSAASPSSLPSLSILRLASRFIEVDADSNCGSDTSLSSVNRLRQRELVEAYESAVSLGFQRCQQLEREIRDLRCCIEEAEADADAKREAHAVDYAYALHFKMQALRQQLELVHRRADAERAAVRCELSDEYADKLQSLRVQLLAAGAQFDDFRAQLQSQLTRQLQLAHTHAVEQLVDGGEPGGVSAMVSASLSVPAKAALLASLPTKQQTTGVDNGPGASSLGSADAVARLERENAAMKRSMLRLQALVAVQQQVQAGARDRELEMTRRHAASDALSRHELSQHRAQMTQLESDVSRLAQDKARAQLHVARLEQEREQAGQRRREAKARVLSAPYYRSEVADRHDSPDFDDDDQVKVAQRTNAFVNGGETNQDAGTTSDVSRRVGHRRLAPSSAPAATSGRRSIGIYDESRTSRSAAPDWEEMEEAFETANERAIRSPGVVRGVQLGEEEAAKNLVERCQRSMQHQQNEIRRLQQQLARESRLKTEALRQLADMKAAALVGDQQDNNAVGEGGASSGGDGSLGLKDPTNPQQQQVRPAIPPSPRRAQSASPCTPMHRRVFASGAGAPPLSTPKRPSTCFSSRASSTSSPLTHHDQPHHDGSSSLKQDAAARPPSTRSKFHVVRLARETKVGGVAGVPNALSAREPLPYR